MSHEASHWSNLLFTYGTLQQGERAHSFLDTAEFLCAASTHEPVLLVDCGGFPGLVDDESHRAYSVTGELYCVPQTLWTTLDNYEGVAEGDYIRREITILTDTQELRKANAYIWQRAWSNLPVVGKDWKTYRAETYPAP